MERWKERVERAQRITASPELSACNILVKQLEGNVVDNDTHTEKDILEHYILLREQEEVPIIAVCRGRRGLFLDSRPGEVYIEQQQ